MIAALGGALTLARSKAFEWAAAAAALIAAVLGFAFVERRAGAQGVRTTELEREVADVHTAEEIRKEVARVPDPKAALAKEFGR